VVIVAAALVTVIAVLAVATGLGLWWRRRDGRLRPAGYPAELEELGVRRGHPVTLVQFSSAFCAPCRATRRICTEVYLAFRRLTHRPIPTRVPAPDA
jgi:hypothetical protein